MTLTLFNSARLSTAYASPGEFISLVGLGIGPDTGVGAQAGWDSDDARRSPSVIRRNARARCLRTVAAGECAGAVRTAGQTSTSATIQYNLATFGPVAVPVRRSGPVPTSAQRFRAGVRGESRWNLQRSVESGAPRLGRRRMGNGIRFGRSRLRNGRIECAGSSETGARLKRDHRPWRIGPVRERRADAGLRNRADQHAGPVGRPLRRAGS